MGDSAARLCAGGKTAPGFEAVAQFTGTRGSGLQRLHEGGLHAQAVQGADGGVRGAAGAGDLGAQLARRQRRLLGQCGGAVEGGQGQGAGLVLAQAQSVAGQHHGLEQVEDIGRARARQRGHRVQLRFLVHPQCAAGGRQQLLDGPALAGAHLGPGVQAGDAAADEGRRVGHGPHHTRTAGGLHQGRAAHPGHHAELKCPGHMGGAGGGGRGENLRLHRPDHGVRRRQRRAGGGQRVQAEALRQPGALLVGGFHHQHLRGRLASLQQPADQGAGHVAAADEGDAAGRGR